MQTLYVTDLDGTLLNDQSVVSAESRRLLNEAIAAGAAVTVATARTPATVADLLRGIDLRMPLAVMTGSALWNPHTGLYSDVRYIAEDEARRALDIYRQYDLPTFVYTLEDNTIHMYHYGPLNADEASFLEARMNTPFKQTHVSPADPDLLPARLDKVILFFAIQPSRPAASVRDELRANLRSTIMYYHDSFGSETALLEIFAEGSSKARAIADLARQVKADRVVAFGDNLNDLPLLNSADVAVAVGNAVDEVKRQADIVIGLNTDDSVAKTILEDFRK